jgi:hypothetical protein
VDHQEADMQGVPRTTPKMLTTLGKPVRGIDWSLIFSRKPELEAPGYKEVFQAVQRAKLEALTDK